MSFTAEHLSMVRQQRADVERRETDLFDPAQSRRIEEKAAISDLFARDNALKFLRVSEHIDPADLARRLLAKLAKAIEEAWTANFSTWESGKASEVRGRDIDRVLDSP